MYSIGSHFTPTRDSESENNSNLMYMYTIYLCPVFHVALFLLSSSLINVYLCPGGGEGDVAGREGGRREA